MALCLGIVMVLSSFALSWVRGEVFVDCGESSVSVRWSERQSLTEPWLLRLGDCPPLSVSVRPGGAEAVFHARFDDCGFRRLVTEDEIVFENELSSEASSQSPSDFSCPIVCAYERPAEWSPPMYDPLSFWVNGRGDLVFRMSFMNDDFSDVATSTTFFLGTLIPIAAAVEQQAHQPLVLLLEECVASASPDPSQDSSVYSIIANKGCLMDSKKANSRFLPRQNPSEIRLYLQAFKFSFSEEVYIHCKLVAWDPEDMNSGRKACQYDKRNERWELLDYPLESAICSCCDTVCRARTRRRTRRAVAQSVVLGPLTIKD
ncbi:zona pellucida sperm-binding protein 3-like [Pygocentrus nattereri]|uniref:ZP domain-containing protein n=1 Tax=Pygocentrus nattereri TaxID=42514 RepID=A0A3B4ED52_PYGNA|nr:zona pellucida sperm-binding protein 3-like [Pygocentrus nattereri]